MRSPEIFEVVRVCRTVVMKSLNALAAPPLRQSRTNVILAIPSVSFKAYPLLHYRIRSSSSHIDYVVQLSTDSETKCVVFAVHFSFCSFRFFLCFSFVSSHSSRCSSLSLSLMPVSCPSSLSAFPHLRLLAIFQTAVAYALVTATPGIRNTTHARHGTPFSVDVCMALYSIGYCGLQAKTKRLCEGFHRGTQVNRASGIYAGEWQVRDSGYDRHSSKGWRALDDSSSETEIDLSMAFAVIYHVSGPSYSKSLGTL